MATAVDATPPDRASQEQRLRELWYWKSADPPAYFRHVRQSGPLAFGQSYDATSVGVLDREDVEFVLRRTDLFSNAMGIMGSTEPVIPVGIDPPLHSEYRRLLDPAFSPRRMAALEPSVAAHANRLIDTFVADGEVDFSQALAVPLPCATFLDLLGLPQSELPQLLYWKDVMIHGHKLAGSFEGGQKLAAETAPVVYEYLHGVIAERRKAPADDVISRLVTSRIEDDGRALSDNEVARCLFQLIAAGLDTVTISLECLLHFTATHPEARRMLAAEPDTTNNLIEELLRWESPVQSASPRLALTDVEIGGRRVEAGTVLDPLIASANIDPAVPGADTVDVRRGDKRHLAFGGGPHRCLGSHLARMELRVVVREWHRRIPEYRIKDGSTVEWNASPLRGVDHLVLQWDAEAVQS